MDSLHSHAVEDNVAHLCSMPGNNACVDCNASRPTWASLGFGTLICLECAGFHRSLGAHITAVRSLTIDKWSEAHLAPMNAGGNAQFLQYVRSVDPDMEQTRFDKYSVPQILYYREIIASKVAGSRAQSYDADKYANMSPRSDAGAKSPTSAGPPEWVPDKEHAQCQVCSKAFTLTFRRHHCRRCGLCVCKECAPKENTRPILEWGIHEPARHCRNCYKSPMVQWKALP